MNKMNKNKINDATKFDTNKNNKNIERKCNPTDAK